MRYRDDQVERWNREAKELEKVHQDQLKEKAKLEEETKHLLEKANRKNENAKRLVIKENERNKREQELLIKQKAIDNTPAGRIRKAKRDQQDTYERDRKYMTPSEIKLRNELRLHALGADKSTRTSAQPVKGFK